MSKCKFETMSFYEGGDGGLTDIVGKKSLFKSKEDFVHWLLNDSEEYESHFDCYKEGEERPVFTEDDIREGYVRYYAHFAEDSGMDIDGGYTFCENKRGSFEVYYIRF